MPLTISSIAIEEKNKLSAESVFLLCVLVTIPGLSDPIPLVANSENYNWDGKEWIAADFQIEEITDSSSGENVQVNVKISNISRVMERYIQEYDIYCKNNGYTPVTIDLYVINTKAVEADPNCDPEVEYTFDLVSPHADSEWVSFTFGSSNPWNKRFPRNRMLKNFCRYRYFKGERCGYTGSATTCDRSLTQCRSYGNSKNFGGTPGFGRGGIRVV